jgi:hypothetical protein
MSLSLQEGQFNASTQKFMKNPQCGQVACRTFPETDSLQTSSASLTTNFVPIQRSQVPNKIPSHPRIGNATRRKNITIQRQMEEKGTNMAQNNFGANLRYLRTYRGLITITSELFRPINASGMLMTEVIFTIPWWLCVADESSIM